MDFVAKTTRDEDRKMIDATVDAIREAVGAVVVDFENHEVERPDDRDIANRADALVNELMRILGIEQ